MNQGIDAIYAEAADVTGRTVTSLHQVAIASFASMLHHGMKDRGRVVWSAFAFDQREGQDFSVEVDVPRRSEVAKERAITVTMHQALKAAKADPDGRLGGVDNGVLTAMLRRGLARHQDGKLVITEAGSWAVDHAPLDPRSQPSSMTRADFDRYVATRGVEGSD